MGAPLVSTRRQFIRAGGGLVAGIAMAGPAGPAFAREAGPGTATRWQSALLRVAGGDRLVYRRDAEGNRLPDFGHAGYRNGAPIPAVPVVARTGPVPGDNTAHLQAALDAVGRLPRRADGFRGALLLAPGEYPVAGTVFLDRDGVVLRGSGSGPDPGHDTVVLGTGDTLLGPPVFIVGGASTWGPGETLWAGAVPGSRTSITSELVAVGERSFTVADPTALHVGDNVIVTHPCTAEWLAAVDGGGTHGGPDWRVGEDPILYNRYVVGIRGNRVTIDAPLFNDLRRELSPSYLYRWDRAGLVDNVGVEHLNIDIQYTGPTDEDQANAGAGIALSLVEDAWVRDCTTRHFWFSGVRTTETTRATIEDCRALDPVASIAGSRRYNFAAGPYSQQILFTGCHATNGRHNFVAFGKSKTSGIVFHRNLGEGSYTGCEGHAGWSQGLLFDNHRELAPNLSAVEHEYRLLLGCRGNYGGNQGWGAVNSVAWRSTVQAPGSLVVQKPPTAQNYAIGCATDVSGNGPFAEPAGYIEGTNRAGLLPESLYEAQRQARRA